VRQWYSANDSFGDEPAEAATLVMESLKDQIAVVTGASSGIGKAVALSLAGHGAEVSLVARRRGLLEDVTKQARALGSRGHACPADLTQAEDVAEMVTHSLRLPRTAEVTDISIRPMQKSY